MFKKLCDQMISKCLYNLHIAVLYLPKCVGSWKGQIRLDTDMDNFNTLLHLQNSYFSYLTLFLLQHSLPDPDVDLVIALIHI